MDLKRSKIKKALKEILERECNVKTKYKGAMNVDEIVAIVALPIQSFEPFAQSHPKIYETGLEITIDVIGHEEDPIEAKAEEINKNILKNSSDLELKEIRSFNSRESDQHINGLQLVYEYQTHTEMEA